MNAPWAIVPEKFLEIQAIYATHLRGEKIDLESLALKIRQPNSSHVAYALDGTTAIIEIDGVLGKKMNLFSSISGGASTQIIGRDIQLALEDPNVKSILLAIDSPGGTVDGTEPLADQIFAARGKKPIVALADGLMGSAAYWIGSAADQVFAADNSTKVGSIGVVATHEDYSQAEHAAGVKVTEITAGKYKRVASAHEPLSQEGRASIQEMVDQVYATFIDGVARNRGVSADKVAEKMGDGKVFLGKQAVKAGLVDGVSTQASLVRSLNQKAAKNFQRAVAQFAGERLERIK
jgi:signal peptide peptidase SppA